MEGTETNQTQSISNLENKHLAYYLKTAKESKRKILGMAIIRQMENGLIQTPWEVPTTEEQSLHMYDQLERAETWDDGIKTKLLGCLLIYEDTLLHPFAPKSTSLKHKFERELYNAENADFRKFRACVVAIQIYNKFYFLEVENVNKAVVRIQRDYDEFFVNRYFPAQKIIGFMLV